MYRLFAVRSFYSKNSYVHPLTILKSLVIIHVALSLFCALFDVWFPQWKLPSPQVLFSLSLWGLKKGFFWQLITYFFVSPQAGGLSLGFILYLLFNMYFLWVVGSSLLQRQGLRHFLILYIGGGVFSGVIASLSLLHTGSLAPIAGVYPALYTILTAWMMILPEMQVLVFFMVPIKIKWLIAGILAINLLTDLSQGHLTHFVLYLSSIGFGYLYALCVWQIHGPFPLFHSFEKGVIRLSHKLQTLFNSSSKYQPHCKGKVYDFTTGKVILSDEEFLDICLSKIATEGKNSLSWLEKWKMKRILKRKKRTS